MNWGHYLFGFSGRLNRAKFWLWLPIYFIAALVVGAIDFIAFIYVIHSPMLAGIVQLAFGIVALVSGLAVMTKRLHDRNKSAWWLVIFVLVSPVLLGIGKGIATSDSSDIRGLISSEFILAANAILIWAFVELACLRGTVGTNRHGPDPLEGEQHESAGQ